MSTSQYAVTGQHHLHSRQQSVNSNTPGSNGGLLLMSTTNNHQELTIMNDSPLPSLAGSELTESLINLQIFVPELQIQKCLTVPLDEIVWDIKRKLFAALPQALPQSFNFGLFLPPCDGRAGKFLLEDRPIRDYPFHDCVPYLELKFKKRVYKMLKLDEKALKQMHSKSNLKKFMDYVQNRNAEKVEKWCNQGMDPNFHDSQGETPLTLAAGIPNNRNVLIALVGGGAHLDFRNSEGQTGMHKAAFLSITENVKTLLELGASPNYRDPIGLTPLYYSMLTTDSADSVAEILLSEAAEVGIIDMHGNHELHQACKNGLMKHVEHLLYYGADINAQNVNGNTPLHVCAVNNRPECAKVLLFRGSDSTITNKQGQTALHVSHIVAHLAVAEIIQHHNPTQAVPYRGAPKYNTRRRLTNPILRRRSLSQSSICSAQSERYQTPQNLLLRQQQHAQQHHPQMGLASPSPSCLTMCPSNSGSTGEYGTLRRYAPDAVPSAPRAGFEPNVPRILVIPRGPKGFGFILRGAKHVDSEVEFEPTPLCPALQFFEGVDMSGMAMKAGLRPGDFLLEINGVDVRCASHEQVVHLIHQSDDTITLKVITIDNSPLNNSGAGGGHYGVGMNGTIQSRRNHSVPRNILPPMPPQRHPSTSLSFARGGPVQQAMGFSMDDSSSTSSNNNYFLDPINQRFSTTSSTSKSMETLNPSESLILLPSSSNNSSSSNNEIRCASVKSRPTASRRISAAELEHLMVRQGTSSTSSQFQPIPYNNNIHDQDVNGPKKYTSVADMKRRKQRGMPSPSLQSNNNNINGTSQGQMHGLPRTPDSASSNGNNHYYATQQMKSSFSNSSPDLVHQQHHSRKPSIDSQMTDYSKPQRILRPKTPPPPPPPMPHQNLQHHQQQIHQTQHHQQQHQEIYGSVRETVVVENTYGQATTPAPPVQENSIAAVRAAPPPPPPPPPPPNFLKSSTPLKIESNKPAPKTTSEIPNGNGAITAEALTSVRLKPVQSSDNNNNNNNNITSKLANPGPKKSLDFDADLRNALAKRRSKVGVEEPEHGNSSSNNSKSSGTIVKDTKITTETTVVGRYGGLSLRESVRENVQVPVIGVTGGGGKPPQHSPPNFANKKDSGYTSSRTSLEPSECGDETLTAINESSNPSSNSSTTTIRIPDQPSDHHHRVTLISQQLEDTYGTPQQQQQQQRKQQALKGGNNHDNISISSTISNFSNHSSMIRNTDTLSSSYVAVTTDIEQQIIYKNGHPQFGSRPLYLEPTTRTPPVDYEDPDSGTGDSDHDDRSAASSSGTATLSSTTTATTTTTNNSNEDDVIHFSSTTTTTTTATIDFRGKELKHWSIQDVIEWLQHLELNEYQNAFINRNIRGCDLINFDRTKYTQLGVTRIAHRQCMEQSLRNFISG